MIFNPKSDQHRISPFPLIAESFIKMMRIKEMIANLTSFDCVANSPFHYQKKCKDSGMENMDIDFKG